MYRPRKAKAPLDDGSLDSLMDVLSCSVGVMLFIVIFAVMEARGTSVAIFAPPLLREPPVKSERILVLAQNGKIRMLDIAAAQEQLLEGSDQLAYAAVPDFVNKANGSKVADKYFRYRLVYRDVEYGSSGRKRVVSMRIEAKPGTVGEDLYDLKSGFSEFEQALTEMGGEKHWLAFGVDADSLKIFRKARLIAQEKGFSTGWDPMAIKFPHEEIVLGGDVSHVAGKPRSGLGIVQ
jgi:hypothetical protein